MEHLHKVMMAKIKKLLVELQFNQVMTNTKLILTKVEMVVHLQLL